MNCDLAELTAGGPVNITSIDLLTLNTKFNMNHNLKALKTMDPSVVEGLAVTSRVGQKGVVKLVAPTVGADNSYTVKIDWKSGGSIYVHLEDCDQIFIDG